MSSSKYAKRMGQLSARIFGDVVRETDQPSMKVMKIFSKRPVYSNPFVVKYYPRHRELKTLMEGLRFHGIYRDEHADFKDEMEQRRIDRGKEKKVPYHIKKRLEKEKAAQENQEDFTS